MNPFLGCQLRKTASPTVYFDGNANIERPCAPGTLFSDKACTCVQDVTIERSETRPGGTDIGGKRVDVPMETNRTLTELKISGNRSKSLPLDCRNCLSVSRHSIGRAVEL